MAPTISTCAVLSKSLPTSTIQYSLTMSDDSQEQVNRNSSPVVVVEDQVATSSNSSSDAADADDKFKAFHLVVSSRRTLYIMGTTALIFVLGLTIGLSSAKSDRNTESDNHPYFNPFVAVEDYEQGGNAVILDDPYFDKISCNIVQQCGNFKIFQPLKFYVKLNL